ncbi:MAG: NAD(P)H-dependent glycerol-3-phosphate dehydrogenase [Acidobacteriaceae bacterium]
MSRIAVLGAGAWGTALALSLVRCGGHQIYLWSHSQLVVEQIHRTGQNISYLPGFPLPIHSIEAGIHVTSSLHEAVAASDILLLVTPSEHLRTTVETLLPWLQPSHSIVSATKGIEDRTFFRMTEVIAQVTAARQPHPRCAVLSGPSFAEEVAACMPTAITIASVDVAFAQQIQRDFSNSSLRLYTNEDVIGVEIGGALKNVIAISSGVVAGLGLGHNSAAALITRGIAEITRLAVACGGRKETLAGLAGIGDLVLTCTGSLSRNRTVGMELGKGRKLPEILTDLHGKVAEGVRTTTAALGLAQRYGVEMPITEQMAAILYEGKSPKDAIRELMARPGRDE